MDNSPLSQKLSQIRDQLDQMDDHQVLLVANGVIEGLRTTPQERDQLQTARNALRSLDARIEQIQLPEQKLGIIETAVEWLAPTIPEDERLRGEIEDALERIDVAISKR